MSDVDLVRYILLNIQSILHRKQPILHASVRRELGAGQKVSQGSGARQKGKKRECKELGAGQKVSQGSGARLKGKNRECRELGRDKK